MQTDNDNGNSEERMMIYMIWHDMDVSKNRGTPKWMVYNGKPY